METRQKQLEEGYVDNAGNTQQGFWQIYIENGARVMRHNGSIYSAIRIVDNIIVRSAPIYIQIQDEVHVSKDLSQTAAGQAVKTDLEKAAEKTKEELTNAKVQVKAEMQAALKNAQEDKGRLKQQYEEQMASLGRRMATESEDRRRRTQEELTGVKAEMENALRRAREERVRLRRQHEAEMASLRQRMCT